MANIPDKWSPVWKQLFAGNRNYELEFLAFKILLGQLRVEYKLDPSETTLNRCIEKALSYFEKTKHMKVAQEDLEKLFS